MKRLLALALLLALLSGCGAASLPAGDMPPETAAPEQMQAEAEGVDLQSIAVPGAEGFYDLTALPQLEAYDITDAQLSGDNRLYFLAGERGEHLHCLDLGTGQEELLCTIPIQEGVDWVSTALLSTQPLAVSQSAFTEEAVYVVGEEGALSRLQAPEGMTIATWNVYFTPSDCIWMDTANDMVIASPLSGEAARCVFQIPGDYFYCNLGGITADGTGAIITACCGREDDVCLTVSLDTGEITGIYWNDEHQEAQRRLQGGVLHEAVPDEAMERYTLTAQDAGSIVTAVFDLKTLAPEGIAVDGRDWWLDDSGVQSFWGRRLVTADHFEDRSWLLLWDYSGVQADPVRYIPLREYTPPEPVTSEKLAVRVQALEQTYGISIHYGEDVDAPFPDYTLSPCTDLSAAADVLNTLEETFALYPEDYFRQLGGDSIRGFSFFLCGRMTPLDPSASIDSPGGLTCLVDGVELLAFDITGAVRRQDVVHELTHVLDHWLWEGDVLNEARWAALNPTGFTYYSAYVNPEGESYEWAGSTEYTGWGDAYYEGDVDSVYFVDPYSTTYPTEDRARLMEFLLSEPDSVPDYFKSRHIQSKLDYYFQCIRQKFDDSAWPEQTSWEKALSDVR